MDALQAEQLSRPVVASRSTSATTTTTNASQTSTIVPTTTQPSSHHRRVSPFERIRRDRNRRSQVSENSEGQITVVADEQINGASESAHEDVNWERKIGPEGWWSSTSSLGVEGAQQRGGMMLNGSGAGREHG